MFSFLVSGAVLATCFLMVTRLEKSYCRMEEDACGWRLWAAQAPPDHLELCQQGTQAEKLWSRESKPQAETTAIQLFGFRGCEAQPLVGLKKKLRVKEAWPVELVTEQLVTVPGPDPSLCLCGCGMNKEAGLHITHVRTSSFSRGSTGAAVLLSQSAFHISFNKVLCKQKEN